MGFQPEFCAVMMATPQPRLQVIRLQASERGTKIGGLGFQPESCAAIPILGVFEEWPRPNLGFRLVRLQASEWGTKIGGLGFQPESCAAISTLGIFEEWPHHNLGFLNGHGVGLDRPDSCAF